MSEKTTSHGATRREFLTTAAAGAAAVAAGLSLVQNAHAAGSDEIKVGLIGCGGRGSGAADNVLHAAKGVEIVALGDYVKANAEACRNRLVELVENDTNVKELGNKVSVTPDRIFSGLDAYKKVIDS